MTKKYLVFCDEEDGTVASRSCSQATFKHLESEVGLCSAGEAKTTARTLLTYRKGGWTLTPAGRRLALYRVAGKSAILLDSSIRCPALRELTDCLDAFLPGRFEDVTEYAHYENKYTREREAFSVNIKTHTAYGPSRDWKGLQNMSLYTQGGIRGGFSVHYGFPFAKMVYWWAPDEMPEARRYRLGGTELMGSVTMLHFSMMFTFILNTIAHNERAAGQPAFRALLRELLLASHPDCWASQTQECPELLGFLNKFQISTLGLGSSLSE